jgi:predicted ATPase/DNA-binding winged helix-turn-helix (wHTH) protein
MSHAGDLLQAVHRFGDVEVRPQQRRLLVHGEPVVLGARAFDLLLTLIERRGAVVSKNELIELVWPGAVIEEHNLTVQVSSLRKLLGAEVIATIPGRGYQFTAMVEGDPASTAAADTGTPANAASTVAPGNLGPHPPALYGRERDVHHVVPLIQAYRLVTLVGAGGIGKTKLGLAVAHHLREHWSDGTWVVELAALSDPSLVAAAVARSLGLKLPGQRPALDELVGGLGRQSLLLVLDNCEHLLGAVSALAQAVIAGTPNIRLLTTSQEALKLADEQQYRVAPLAVPEVAADADARSYGAVALFEARVRAADPHFTLDGANLPAVIDICRRLDGLPLAIELAAVRVPVLGVQGVHQRLDERFQLLTGGSRIALRRHQTLRATLEWSYNLLSGDEQALFRCLGVFAGGFTIELIRGVAHTDGTADEWAVIDTLAALVEKSLVIADVGDAAPRYRLLETPRAYALEQLAVHGESAACLRRHALSVCALFVRIDDASVEGRMTSERCAAVLSPEADNLRAAYRWSTSEAGELPIAIRLAAAAGGHDEFAAQCAEWLHSLAPQVDDTTPPDDAAAFWFAVARPWMFIRLPQALVVGAARRAAALYASLGKPMHQFFALLMAERPHSENRDEAAAQRCLDEARALMQAHWPLALRGRLLNSSAHVLNDLGRWQEAVELWTQYVQICSESGDWRNEAQSRSNLADCLWRLGRLDEARRQLDDLARRVRRRATNSTGMAFALANLTAVLSESDRADEAADVAREALPFLRRSGLLRYFADDLVYLLALRGQVEAAARLLGASQAYFSRMESPRQANEQRLFELARRLVEAMLPANEVERLVREGATLDDSGLGVVVEAALAAS